MRSIGILLAGLLLAGATGVSAADDYVVLQVAPAVNQAGSAGWQAQVGAKIYFDEVNNRGGVAGHAIKFVAVDQAADISAQVRELAKTKQPVALFGTIGPLPVRKLVGDRVLEALQLPLVGARTGSMDLVSEKSSGWLFLTRPGYATEAEKVLKQYSTIGVSKVVVLYSEDVSGREILEQVKLAAMKGGQMVEAAIPQPRDAAHLAMIVDKLANGDHQALLLATDTASAGAFLKRYREQGGTAQVVAMSSVEAVQMAQIAGPLQARGTAVVQVAPSPRNDAVAVVREFKTCYRKYGPYTEEPTQAMMEGYLAAKVLVEGLKRGNGGHAALQHALSGLSNFDAGGVSFSFGRGSRSAASYLEMSVLDREGRIVR